MTQQFTANEVRGQIAWLRNVTVVGTKTTCQMLDGYADLLEAQEKAVPVRQFRVVPKGSTWTDVKDEEIWAAVTAHPESYETRVLYTHSTQAQFNPAKVADHIVDAIIDGLEAADAQAQPPADAERLAEALHMISLVHSDCARNDTEKMEAMCRIARGALSERITHSAQAQPPAASVTEVTGLTWEPPNVTVDVERVGRFRSGDEHIVRVTFRSSDDGRRMTCFYSANESAVGYLHAMLAAQENPNG